MQHLQRFFRPVALLLVTALFMAMAGGTASAAPATTTVGKPVVYAPATAPAASVLSDCSAQWGKQKATVTVDTSLYPWSTAGVTTTQNVLMKVELSTPPEPGGDVNYRATSATHGLVVNYLRWTGGKFELVNGVCRVVVNWFESTHKAAGGFVGSANGTAWFSLDAQNRYVGCRQFLGGGAWKPFSFSGAPLLTTC